jgi:hypothetical protein
MIPAHVVHTRLATKPVALPVLLPDGTAENWNLIWNTKRSSQCHIGNGWYNFVKSGSIRLGDKIQFWAGPYGFTRVNKNNG